MNPPDNASPAREINRLHEEVVRQTDGSRKCLHTALVAAWQAGQLLLAEQKRVRRSMGGAWGQWLEKKFGGSRRTAQNYMVLAENVTDVAAFQGMSLRQVYLRLGIATEPKSRTESARVKELPAHIRFASKLLFALKARSASPPDTPEQWMMLRRDLWAVYEQLRRIFEAGPAANTPLESAHPVLSTVKHS